MDMTPLILSLKTAVVATVITFALGLFCAWKVVHMRRGKGIVDTLFTIPLVLPPTVLGFFLLVFLGKNSPVGIWLEQFGISFVFSWIGTVAASAVVSFPLMYRTARGAFEQFDSHLYYAAQTLGMSNFKIFWRVVFPNCLPGIIGGVILAFARALGEFGATIMLAGNIPGKTQTAAIAVYSAMQAGNREKAYQWVAAILVISLMAVLGMNFVNSRQKGVSEER